MQRQDQDYGCKVDTSVSNRFACVYARMSVVRTCYVQIVAMNTHYFDTLNRILQQQTTYVFGFDFLLGVPGALPAFDTVALACFTCFACLAHAAAIAFFASSTPCGIPRASTRRRHTTLHCRCALDLVFFHAVPEHLIHITVVQPGDSLEYFSSKG